MRISVLSACLDCRGAKGGRERERQDEGAPTLDRRSKITEYRVRESEGSERPSQPHRRRVSAGARRAQRGERREKREEERSKHTLEQVRRPAGAQRARVCT